MSQVFLSYERGDLARVKLLREALEKDGQEVWTDQDIEAGELYRSEIGNKLDSAGCVVVCWSKTSIHPGFVIEEANQAKKRNTLLPVCIDPVAPPLGFREYQNLDLAQWPPSAAQLDRLTQAVRKKLTPRPALFVASTIDDLDRYREQIRSAAHALGFAAILSGEEPGGFSLATADVVFVIVAHRYGKQVRDAYDEARRLNKPVTAILVDPSFAWPPESTEKHRTQEALDSPDPARLITEVKRDIALLEDLKAELCARTPPPLYFTDPHSLREPTIKTLQEWAAQQPKNPLQGAADHELYLKYLEDDTRQIRIRALKSKRAEPYFFGIDEIYIPLTTTTVADGKHRSETDLAPRRVTLENALTQRKLVIIGEPGAGKSTFLRRTAFELCRNLRGTRPADAQPFLDPKDRRLPILIRIGDLAKVLTTDQAAGKLDDSPDWILHFLNHQSRGLNWRLSYEFFERKLKHEGGCLLMIDGLDEAPDRRVRERIARIFEKATAAFDKCDFLVTTRPQSYSDASVLAGFHALRIGDLEPAATLTFLQHFARALALNEAESEKFQRELKDALEQRSEIREMATNPVMLTALAVLQHNDQRLPEHRVQLYESIVEWLAAAREQKPDRPEASRCLEVMRRLALHMQDAPGGKRLVQINRRKAAEFIDREFGGGVEECEKILDQETEESGIISPVGADLKFWHLSFQEYLAAREIASLREEKQTERILAGGKLYRPEWRETMRLLGAILRLQGEEKIEGLVEAILGSLGDKPALPEKAPCVALLGAMMRDLARMDYRPKSGAYESIVTDVMRIFQAGPSQEIDLGIRIEAADALGAVGDPRLEENNWITIPAGKFRMGAQKKEPNGQNYDPEAGNEESPVHEVSLGVFRIRRFPVTVQEFSEFIKDKGYLRREHWSAGGFGEFREPENWEKQQSYSSRPVVGVSWFEAAAYCAWFGGRLPTEAEWERVARGPASARYPWGDKPPLDGMRANYLREPGHPTPVGLYPLGNSVEGVSDLLGNVWEWTADWFKPYSGKGKRSAKEWKVMRGGSWIYNPQFVRVSSRVGSVPAVRFLYIGFRCAGKLS